MGEWDDKGHMISLSGKVQHRYLGDIRLWGPHYLNKRNAVARW